MRARPQIWKFHPRGAVQHHDLKPSQVPGPSAKLKDAKIAKGKKPRGRRDFGMWRVMVDLQKI